LDAEINLVPFIDLLTCLISFLLISAVWTQVAKIAVAPAPNQQAVDQQNNQEPPLKVTIHIRGNGYYFIKNADLKEMPKSGEEYPTKALSDALKALRAEVTEQDLNSITVMSDDNIQYKQLVQVMDICLQYKFDAITVSGA